MNPFQAFVFIVVLSIAFIVTAKIIMYIFGED